MSNDTATATYNFLVFSSGAGEIWNPGRYMTPSAFTSWQRQKQQHNFQFFQLTFDNSVVGYIKLDKKFELMLRRRAKAYSMLMLIILQPFSRKTGQHRKNGYFYGGTVLWCLRAQVFFNLENGDLDRWNLRSMLKISYATCPCLSQFRRNSLLKCVSQPEIAKKSIKNPISAFKVIQGHWIGRQLRASIRLLLVINSNLAPRRP